ncbi:electron transport complex subunit RsxC [Glaciecola sp. MH2013]|uniref:electron transport complex subunit RsxC n=1 Tax=Glaciecola sp. MH2013 TaxID=2785524 RepID=UPI0018A05A1A|nr:electron transport complex subunit RsxC [Glaciecola sp. MH2013]
MFADYDQIMERLSVNQLWDFPGGVHPEQKKSLSNQHNIEAMPLASAYYVPVKQHIGVHGELLVEVGDHVLKGQALTNNEQSMAVPVHAPSSGTVTNIAEHVSAHPSGIPELTVTIEPDGQDQWISLKPVPDFTKVASVDLINMICEAGISGLGGAGFPTHIKTTSVQPTEFLIINGIECEPYISSDDRLMREHAWQIRQGIDILVHILQPKQVLVAVEDNKPEALETMAIACQQKDNYQVVSVPTKYPAGGEKQLIQVLTSREVPANGLPSDVACIMYNVGTCYAIADAIVEGKPLIKRVVTITGEAVQTPKNVWARLGTPVEELLESAGYLANKQKEARVVMGGPMMGFAITSTKTPVVKITNCLLVPSDEELPHIDDERACIRCSACADACPVSLLPQQMFWYSKAKELDKAQEYHLFDCIECGACAYVCPSEIPLVHYYRQAKADIRNQQEEKAKSEKAKIRFEARKARLQREKEEREEKHRLAAEARKSSMTKDGGAAKDKIAAALARAKAKKEALAKQAVADTTTPSEKTTNETSARSTNQATVSTEQTSKQTKQDKDSDKKAKVAAAIAKAKAKKTKQAAGVVDETSAPSSKKKKNSPITKIPEDTNESEVPAAESEKAKAAELKKKRVAAALAKAKAKKAREAKAAKQKQTEAAEANNNQGEENN